MLGELNKENRRRDEGKIESFKAEVAVLESELRELQQQHLRAPLLIQKFALFFGFGAAGKLERARFKLKFKQEELQQRIFQPLPEVAIADSIIETTRQKMMRMIAENPAELEPHIRRVYQALLAVEK